MKPQIAVEVEISEELYAIAQGHLKENLDWDWNRLMHLGLSLALLQKGVVQPPVTQTYLKAQFEEVA